MRKKWKVFIFIVIQVCTGAAYAQNLVPNPGFETLKTSPSCWTFGAKQDFDNMMEDWFLPSDGTTDLLSTLLDTSCIVALPTSTYPAVDWFPRGYQYPRTGTNVVGIKPFYETRREYLEVKLNCELTPGQEYYCEMYVSLAEGTNYAQNSLGMYFSDTMVYVASTAMLSFTPQIVETTILEDTVNWVKISGNFIATSAHRYLIIGNFATTAQMQTKYIGPKSDVDFPYYYIDDVLVRVVNPPAIVWSGDTTVCKGDTVSLTTSGTDITWYEGTKILGRGINLQYKPETSNTLTIMSKSCQWTQTETLELVVFPLPSPALGMDTLICSGTTIMLDAGVQESYVWEDGSNTRLHPVSLAGSYSVTVEDTNGCKNTDRIEIGFYQIPKVDLGEDQLTCKPMGTLSVATSQSGDQYRWQNNSTAREFVYAEEGTYSVEVHNVCGDTDADTIVIKKIEMIVPNLITPNGDDYNETFQIQGTEEGKGKLLIYNRYGSTVYSTSNYSNDWSGANLSDDVYYFLFNYPSCSPRKGWIQIIR